MTILVSVETVLLALLLLLVAALLRSHAEILARLERQVPQSDEPPGPEVTPQRPPGAPGSDLSGLTLYREDVTVPVRDRRDTLIAFLSSGCLTCQGFWDAFAAGNTAAPGGARLVVVTKDASHESPSKLRSLAAPGLTVVMSTRAWDDYDVPMSPYFVYVTGQDGTIAGEGSAQTWDQVLSLVRDALLDAGESGGTRGPERFARADSELAAAGIDADHPSLYEADDPAIVAGIHSIEPGLRARD
jgi:hypothetical protein